MIDLAHQIELFLIESKGWVPMQEICTRFNISARGLRAYDDAPSILDDFAMTCSERGAIHHNFLDNAEFDAVAGRKHKHAVGELKRLKRQRTARARIREGLLPHAVERHTGQHIFA